MEKDRNYTVEWGLALLRYLNLVPNSYEKSYIRNNWSRFYQNFDQDPLKAIINLYADLPILKSDERSIDTREIRINRHRILSRIEESETREKYESGVLDDILRTQEDFS